MPSIAVRRILLAVGALGIIMFCGGLSLYMNSQFATARILLLAANVLIIPLFVYFVFLRSRASAEYRRRQRKRQTQAEAKSQQELAALAEVDELLKANKTDDSG